MYVTFYFDNKHMLPQRVAAVLQADIDSLWRSAWAQATDTAQQQAVSASLQRICKVTSVTIQTPTPLCAEHSRCLSNLSNFPL
jgi:hypothetical protein